MKRLMIVGASVLQLPAIKKAKEMGLEVAVVDFNPEAIGIAFADKYYNASTMDEDAVLAAAEDYKPDGIMTLATDMPMRGVAKSSDKLGLHSIDYMTAVKATDKYDMIKAFKEHDVPSPWYYLVSTQPTPNPSQRDGKMPTSNSSRREENYGYMTADPCLYEQLKAWSEENRNNPTEAESVAWNMLKGDNLGYQFRRQHILGDYIVDFVCLQKKLVVEIDGEYHNEYEQQIDDAVRTAWLNSKGFQVLRFTNAEVIGAPDSTMHKISTALKVLPFGEDLGRAALSYPCIMKPTDNAGSHGVVKVESFEELVKSYEYSHQSSRHGNVIVEEYLDGPEVSVEVMVVNGKVNVLQITDKLTTGAPYFVELGHSQPSQLSAEVQEQIRDVATRACKAVGIRKGPAHVEMKITTKDGPKMVELGARMGGDNITTSLVPLSTGIDMVQATIHVALGEEPDIEPKLHCGSAIRYFQLPFGKIKSISGVEEARALEGVREITFTKEVGEESTPIHCSNDRVGSVIAQAATAEEAVKVCEEAMKIIKIEIEG